MFNPLLPSAASMRHSAKFLFLFSKGSIKKFFERRNYESVDEKSLS